MGKPEGNRTQLLKRFVAYYRPHWKLFTLDMLCAFMIAAADLVFPVVSRHIMKDIIPEGNMRFLAIFSGALVLFYLVIALFHYVVNYWGHVVGVRMGYDMRKDLFAHLQTLSFRFYENNRTGHIMSR